MKQTVPPGRQTLVADLLITSAARFPLRKAVIFPDSHCTYAGLLSGAQTVARGLAALGLAPGERVGLLAINGVPFLEGLFGALLAGCVVVPINARHRAAEIGYIIRDAGLAAILTTAEDDSHVSFTALLAEAVPGLSDHPNPGALNLADTPELRVAALLDGAERPGFLPRATLAAQGQSIAPAGLDHRRQAIGPRDLAMILYTSGTTANPKGCLLSHEALSRGAVERAGTRFRTSDHDVAWNAGPLFHIAAFGPMLGSIGTGGTLLSDIYFDGARAVALMQREGVTMAWPWFPAILQRLLEQPGFDHHHLPALRRIMLIAPEAMVDRLYDRFPDADIMQACGMTETAGIFAVSDPGESRASRANTQGRMVPGMACRIVDPQTLADLPDGQMGEIWVRGYCVTDGYHRAPEKTAEALTPDGWLRTGDLYIRQPDGSLLFKGRLKDMLKVGGENVAAIEVEAFLCSHPAVRLAEVVGKPHPDLDEVPVAFVELHPGQSATAEDIIAFCRGRIARYKIPVEVRFVEPDAWPMSATKVNKRALRAMLA